MSRTPWYDEDGPERLDYITLFALILITTLAAVAAFQTCTLKRTHKPANFAAGQ